MEPNLDNLPCEILLSIASKINPTDFLRLSQVARSIKTCLDTKRLNPSEQQKANKFLDEFVKKYELYYLPKIYVKGKSYSILKLYKSVEHGFNTRKEFENFVNEIPVENLIIRDDGTSLYDYVWEVEDMLGSYEPLNGGRVVIVFDYNTKSVRDASSYEARTNPNLFTIWAK